MKLSPPPSAYDQRDQTALRQEAQRADGENYKRGRDLELIPNQRLIIPSPNGTRWLVTISNTGVLTTAALP